ncbi:MAG TPA: ethanolamine ammonia-lyase subunit EutC [Polyangia bacterium]
MAALIDRQRVVELVRGALAELGTPGASPKAQPHEAALLAPDRGAHLVAPFDAEAMKALYASTPARIGVGRAGSRYRTSTLLRFRADHAAAKDAVLSEVDPKLVEKLGLLEIATRAADKRIFLERPDAGRALSDEAREVVQQKCARAPQLQVCYGDGLSAAALNAHLEAFHGALLRELGQRGIKIGTPLFVRHSRVKVMDEIARLLDAEACLFVCGERPGLGFSDSLSAYYIYRPASGATDADREVVSNINPRGLEPVKAAQVVAEACARILRDRKSGVVLG